MNTRTEVNSLQKKLQTLQTLRTGRMTLRDLRKSLHLTQEAFAELLGVSRNTLRHYETGRVKPAFTVEQFKTLHILLNEIGASWEDLANDLSNPEKTGETT